MSTKGQVLCHHDLPFALTIAPDREWERIEDLSLCSRDVIPIPAQVDTDTWSWASHQAAVTADGRLYLWDVNFGGELLLPPVWKPAAVRSNLTCRLPPAL